VSFATRAAGRLTAFGHPGKLCGRDSSVALVSVTVAVF
jgi:hypothetical protein